MQQKIFFFVIAIFSFLNPYSQTTTIDSLKTQLRNTNSNTELLKINTQLSTILTNTSPQDAEPFLRNAILLAKKTDQKELANSYKLLATLYEKTGKLDHALTVTDSAILYLDNIDTLKIELEILKGNILRRKSKYDEAMEHLFNAEKLSEKIANKKYLYASKSYLGICNVSIKNYTKAAAFHKEAIAIATAMNDNKRLAKSYGNIGIIFRENEKYDSANFYNQKALEFALLSKDSSSISYAYNEAGTVLDRMGKSADATAFLLNAKNIRERNDEKIELPYTYFYLGRNYGRLGNIKEGEYWVRKALTLAQSNGNTKQVIDSYNMLHYFFKDNHMPDSALVNYTTYKELEDSVDNSKVKMKIEELNIQYETEKKDNLLKSQKLRITYLIASLLFLGLIFIYLYNQSRKKQLKLQVNTQKAIAEEQIKNNLAIINAEESERKRISRDLHDNMGAYTSALIANVQQQKSKFGETVETNKMQSNAEQILASLRDTIWVLNNKEVTISSLSDDFKNYCIKVFNNFEHIQFNVEEQIDNNIKLPANTALHLKKIMQEVVQNSIKHAQATAINYSILSNEKLIITIADNGIGFDNENIKNGYGLENMEYRAKEIGFVITLDKTFEKGTKYIIQS